MATPKQTNKMKKEKTDFAPQIIILIIIIAILTAI